MENKRVRDLQIGQTFRLPGMAGRYRVLGIEDKNLLCKAVHTREQYRWLAHHCITLGINSMQFVEIIIANTK